MKAVKLFWIFSLFVFLGTLLYIYADAPESLSLFGPLVDKRSFFYYTLGIMVAGNSILLLFAHSFPYFPRPWLKFPNSSYWLENGENTKALYLRAKEWVRGFALLLNLFLCVAMLGVYAKYASAQPPMMILMSVVAVMTVAWCGSFFAVFSKQQ